MDIIDYFERNYRQLLLSAVMMIKDVDKAQDILHNVAVALLKKQNELRDMRYPGAYIAQCIYRATLNYLRKEARSAAFAVIAIIVAVIVVSKFARMMKVR